MLIIKMVKRIYERKKIC